MENKPTPAPDSEAYNVGETDKLNTPKFNSSTEKRTGAELPAIENMNDEQEDVKPEDADVEKMPEADLGNKRSEDEDQDERIIRR